SLVSIILYNLYQQKKAEKLQSAFENAAASFRLTLTEQNIVGKLAIGFDKTRKKLLFLAMDGSRKTLHFVNLREIKSCMVVKTYALLKRSRVSLNEIIQTVGLQFNYHDAGKTLVLPFYNKETDATNEMMARAEFAEYWQKLLSGSLSKYNGEFAARPKAFPSHKFFYDASLK
ncbi:hypothetical protein, partial [Flavihumibacter solisilvae]